MSSFMNRYALQDVHLLAWNIQRSHKLTNSSNPSNWGENKTKSNFKTLIWSQMFSIQEYSELRELNCCSQNHEMTTAAAAFWSGSDSLSAGLCWTTRGGTECFSSPAASLHLFLSANSKISIMQQQKRIPVLYDVKTPGRTKPNIFTPSQLMQPRFDSLPWWKQEMMSKGRKTLKSESIRITVKPADQRWFFT